MVNLFFSFKSYVERNGAKSLHQVPLFPLDALISTLQQCTAEQQSCFDIALGTRKGMNFYVLLTRTCTASFPSTGEFANSRRMFVSSLMNDFFNTNNFTLLHQPDHVAPHHPAPQREDKVAVVAPSVDPSVDPPPPSSIIPVPESHIQKLLKNPKSYQNMDFYRGSTTYAFRYSQLAASSHATIDKLLTNENYWGPEAEKQFTNLLLPALFPSEESAPFSYSTLSSEELYWMRLDPTVLRRAEEAATKVLLLFGAMIIDGAWVMNATLSQFRCKEMRRVADFLGKLGLGAFSETVAKLFYLQ